MKKQKRVQYLNKQINIYSLWFGLIELIILVVISLTLIENYKENSALNYQIIANQPAKAFDNFMETMDQTAQNISTNTKIINKFSNSRLNKNDGNFLDEIEISSVMKNVNQGFKKMWRISIYDNKENFISYGAMVDDKMVHDNLTSKYISNIENVFNHNNRGFILTTSYRDMWTKMFDGSYISFKRPIRDLYTNKFVGVVDVEQKLKDLETAISFEENSHFKVDIYDENGRVIIKQSTDDDIVVAKVTSEKYLWNIDLIEPKSVSKIAIAKIIIVSTFQWIILVILTRCLVSLISSRVTKPLAKLKSEVDEKGVDYQTKISLDDINIEEIYQLSVAFNNLCSSLEKSLEAEKKSYFLALQAQMNPHFLYNILSVINAVAIDGRSEDVIEICGNLSELLHYTSSYKSSIVTIAEEVDHCDLYLKLMKSRYSDMFEYTISLDDELKSIKIPKLTIQPLCENCFSHGFLDVEPPYKIEVIIKSIDAGFYIFVKDNGEGIKAEKLNNIYEDIHKSVENMEIGGLGLKSAVVRLKMTTEKEITWEIGNNCNKGAFIKIDLKDINR